MKGLILIMDGMGDRPIKERICLFWVMILMRFTQAEVHLKQMV